MFHSIFFKKIRGQTRNDGATNVVIMVPLKYLSNFWRTFEMLLVNCEVILMLTWSKNCFSDAGIAVNQEPIFTKPYVTVVTLSTQDNAQSKTIRIKF